MKAPYVWKLSTPSVYAVYRGWLWYRTVLAPFLGTLLIFRGFSYGPLVPSLKGSELWAPILKVVQNGAIVGL